MSNQMICLAGGSCSGKTTLVTQLQIQLAGKLAAISFDEYFLGLERLSGQKIDDWEDPALYRYIDYLQDLQKLRNDQTISLECHSRESVLWGVKNKVITPMPITLVEGFLTLYNPQARKFFDVTIFIDLPEDEMIRRRLARSQSDGGWDDRSYIEQKLIPGYRKYVLPQRQLADYVINGLEKPEILAKKIVKIISKN